MRVIKSPSDLETEKRILQELEERIKDKPFSIDHDAKICFQDAQYIAEIVVLDLEKRAKAAIIVNQKPQYCYDRFIENYNNYFYKEFPPLKYFIYTDGDSYWVFSPDELEHQPLTLAETIELIANCLPGLGEPPSFEDIIKAVADSATKAHLKQRKSILAFLDKNRQKSLFSEDKSTGRILFSSTTAEDKFFSFLLDGKTPYHLCRFTKRNSLFQLLVNGKQNMCSIVCMNDKSEENYADKRVGRVEDEGKKLEDNNNCFILSLLPAKKVDDLTMWRLYGDDAKGVCLHYVLEGRKRFGKLENDFYISRISYGIDDNHHPELDFLRLLFGMRFQNWRFHFNRWEIWKHFFKSFRFKDEEEVRLLFLSDGSQTEDDTIEHDGKKIKVVETKWIENSESGIVSKMMLFQMKPINVFPLRLSAAIVGPKAPEPHKIAEQFAFLVSQEWKSYPPIMVDESDIKEYR